MIKNIQIVLYLKYDLCETINDKPFQESHLIAKKFLLYHILHPMTDSIIFLLLSHHPFPRDKSLLHGNKKKITAY